MGRGVIFTSFTAALGQAFDPRFRRVLLLGLGLTVGLLAGVYALVLYLLNLIFPESVTLPLIGEITWLNDVLTGGSLLVMLGLSVFLMVPVASAFTGIFLDDVAQAVEDRHYPTLSQARPVPFGEALRDTVSFLGVLILVNLAALALYVLFPPLALPIFWSVNGFLLGREYFQMVAMRRISRAEAMAARRRYAGRIWMAGTLMAVPLTIPIMNLIIPILGVATFTHIYHRSRAQDG